MSEFDTADVEPLRLGETVVVDPTGLEPCARRPVEVENELPVAVGVRGDDCHPGRCVRVANHQRLGNSLLGERGREGVTEAVDTQTSPERRPAPESREPDRDVGGRTPRTAVKLLLIGQRARTLRVH
ncbi:MAG: hypothetical protein J07HB67_01019, partial [halophilic archaeon J07HB67]